MFALENMTGAKNLNERFFMFNGKEAHALQTVCLFPHYETHTVRGNWLQAIVCGVAQGQHADASTSRFC
jgi:hypothetical protein